MRDEIPRRLGAAEEEHGIRVLYACESGSRAWGSASPDSDFDVRFTYAHEADWYLSFDVERRRDVIEYPIVDAIDCGGWDIRKALYLFTRTNGAFLEWLNSQGDPVPEINEFIEVELTRHGEAFSGQGRPDLLVGGELRASLNEVFRAAITERSQRAT